MNRSLPAIVCLIVLFGISQPLDCYGQTEVVLYSFKNNNQDGGFPGGLTYDAVSQTFYGVTTAGGATNNGNVFQIKQEGMSWKETVLYNFLGIQTNDCSGPDSELTPLRRLGAITALYGTCENGGTNNEGVVFQLTPQPDGSWKESIIFNFQSVSDGAIPIGGVTLDGQGNLYGTTQVGGPGLGGTVYQLVRSNNVWIKKVLHGFNSPANPEGRLIFDRNGALYGTTPSDGPSFSGTVYQLVPPQSGQTDWTYNVLYTFTGQTGTGDGATPRAGLLIKGKGVLYGTTEGGGNAGLGTVFKLLPPAPNHKNWREKQLYRFASLDDGAAPFAGLTAGKSGVIYGSTSAGGANFAGTVFQLKFDAGKWTKTTLWTFGGSDDGVRPVTPMLFLGGILYGTAPLGGLFGRGVMYQIMP